MAYMDTLDLQMFAEGGDGSAATGTAGTGNENTAGTTDAAASQEIAALNEKRLKRNPLANVHYGKQPEAAGQAGGAAAITGQQAAEGETFDSLISGKYKKEFGAKVQGIIQDRLKNAHDAEGQLEKLAPMMDALAKKYGIAADDLDTMVAKVTDDDSLYEDEAMARGIDVQTLKQIKALERDKQQADRMRQQADEESRMQQHYQKLVQQGEALKKTFPQFDLQQEILNPEFVRLTSPGVGIDVATAYQVIHRDEIMPAAMQYAVQKTQQQTAAAIAANARRPVENGVGGASQVADVRDDPRKWTRADREEVRRRVRNGEKIQL